MFAGERGQIILMMKKLQSGVIILNRYDRNENFKQTLASDGVHDDAEKR